MVQDEEMRNPSPNSPIDHLVRPKGFPILVLHNLAALDMPSNFPKFWGTKDNDMSRPMGRYIEDWLVPSSLTLVIIWCGSLPLC